MRNYEAVSCENFNSKIATFGRILYVRILCNLLLYLIYGELKMLRIVVNKGLTLNSLLLLTSN